MAMNKYMHPRNIYKTPPNFKELALQFPEFRKYVSQDITGKVTLDFKDLEALRALSCTLLRKDFDLDVEIPSNKLIPTIPLRLNYILWLEDLMSFIGRLENVSGIDIGTGASCVYPLLAARKNKWSILATEVDDTSVKCAKRNIENNLLEQLIKVAKVREDQILKDLANDSDYDFCMCNPPFFANSQELNPYFNARKISRPKPKNSFCAAVTEVVVKGGEVDFISRLIYESKELDNKIKIYTTMVGHKSSLPQLKKILREVEVNSFCESELCQGNTTRWVLAWTFCTHFDLRKCPNPAKIIPKSVKPIEPSIYKFDLTEVSEYTLNLISDNILKMFGELQMVVQEISKKRTILQYIVIAHSNTWSNQRRKRREMKRKSSNCHVENNNESLRMESPENSIVLEPKSPSKRTFEDSIESNFIKKLKIEEGNGKLFFKFKCILKVYKSDIFLELSCLEEHSNKDYLHQILQFIKNNFKM